MVCPFANVQVTVQLVDATEPLVTVTEAPKPPGHWLVMEYAAVQPPVPVGPAVVRDGVGDAVADRDGEGDADADRDGDGDAEADRDGEGEADVGLALGVGCVLPLRRSATRMPRPLVPR